MKDLNLGEKLILDVVCCVSLQGSQFTFTNRLRPLLLQLFLEAGKHLEKLIFGRERCLGLIGPLLGHGSWKREVFITFFDVNVWEERRTDDPHVPGGH